MLAFYLHNPGEVTWSSLCLRSLIYTVWWFFPQWAIRWVKRINSVKHLQLQDVLHVNATSLAQLCTWHCSNAHLCLARPCLKHWLMGEGTGREVMTCSLDPVRRRPGQSSISLSLFFWVLLLLAQQFPHLVCDCLFTCCFSLEVEPLLWQKLRFPGLCQVHGRGPEHSTSADGLGLPWGWEALHFRAVFSVYVLLLMGRPRQVALTTCSILVSTSRRVLQKG